MLLQTICNCFDVGKRNVSFIAEGFEANVTQALWFYCIILEVGGSGVKWTSLLGTNEALAGIVGF